MIVFSRQLKRTDIGFFKPLSKPDIDTFFFSKPLEQSDIGTKLLFPNSDSYRVSIG